MRTVKLVSVMVVLLVGQAMAQDPSRVSFTLELGGSNNNATCLAVDQPDFSAGSPADYVTYNKTLPLTWDAKIAATGNNMVMQGTPPAPAYYPVRGVANFVCNIKLYKDTVNPGSEIAADFYSSTNDGTDNCPTTSAAFAYSWNVNSLASWQPGRIFAAYKAAHDNTGGPWMEVHTYPTDASNGILLGMGAGYAQWKRVSNAEWSTAGVGQVDPQLCDPSAAIGCLGLGPACEGQINVSALNNGTYILVLEPGAGINVLRGDLDKTGQSDCTPAHPELCDGLDQTKPAFAVAAEQTAGDEIRFILGSTSCQIDQWASVQMHGPAGEKGIVLEEAPTSGATVTSETREGGLEKLLVDFTSDVHLAHTAGQISIVGGGTLSVLNESFINGGETFVITFSGSTDMTCPTISLANSFSGWVQGADKDCRVRILWGDVNTDQKTDLTDMALSKSEAIRVPAPTLDSEPWMDVNVDSYINLTDMALVKSLATMVPAHSANCN